MAYSVRIDNKSIYFKDNGKEYDIVINVGMTQKTIIWDRKSETLLTIEDAILKRALLDSRIEPTVCIKEICEGYQIILDKTTSKLLLNDFEICDVAKDYKNCCTGYPISRCAILKARKIGSGYCKNNRLYEV